MKTPTNTAAVTGPFRIYVRQTPVGAKLDVSHYLNVVLRGLAQVAAEDPEGFVEELTDLAALDAQATREGKDSHAQHELDDRLDHLIAEVADDGSLPLSGKAVHGLIDRLAQIEVLTPRPIPAAQAESGVAA
ncbi:hypothetical protein [Streptomyces sp. SID11385]|uniref:hypothetical protein n=1 Tax=Streptomyces sp. SID11385 TaxID=2706031 RepID=UPI0013CD1527|nr:hypothetical protein [Streptomyces sp. SID11385]NEA40920.1 hypothetical protein [Streptomyces sp. SID11385]